MTKTGHLLTGLALMTAMTGFREAALLVGILLGCTAPDYLEMSYRDIHNRWDYGRLIPHRTLTHWVLPWVGLLLAGIFLPMEYLLPEIGIANVITTHIRWGIVGFASGGVLHLFCDWMTPMGIPFLRPFGKRHSLRWYRTGGLGELLAVACICVICMGVGYINITHLR